MRHSPHEDEDCRGGPVRDLIGKQVVIVANLKPTKIMGILSQGMVLTATKKKTCRLITVDGPAEPGTPLS